MLPMESNKNKKTNFLLHVNFNFLIIASQLKKRMKLYTQHSSTQLPNDSFGKKVHGVHRSGKS